MQENAKGENKRKKNMWVNRYSIRGHKPLFPHHMTENAASIFLICEDARNSS